MRKAFKRILSLTFAIVLLMSVVTVVNAEEAIETSDGGGSEPHDVVSTPVVVVEATPAPTQAPTPAPTQAPVEQPQEPAETPEQPQEPIDVPEQPQDPTGTPPEQPLEQAPDEEPVVAIPTEEPILDPTEEPIVPGSITIMLHGIVGGFQYGDTVTLEAFVNGFAGVSYTITWECSDNGIDWYAAPGVNHDTIYQFQLTEQNAYWGWRAAVDIP